MLLDPNPHKHLIKEVQPREFYAVANEAIWMAMGELLAADNPIDVTLLAERLKRDGAWETVGGPAYLVEILQSQAVAIHAEHYAAIVHEKFKLRRIVHATCNLFRACYDPGASLENGGEVRKAAMELLEILGI